MSSSVPHILLHAEVLEKDFYDFKKGDKVYCYTDGTIESQDKSINIGREITALDMEKWFEYTYRV